MVSSCIHCNMEADEGQKKANVHVLTLSLKKINNVLKFKMSAGRG